MFNRPQLFLRTWYDRCRDGTLYGVPADPVSLLATSFRARFDVVLSRIRGSEFSEEEYIDFEQLSCILGLMVQPETQKDFPAIPSAICKAGVLPILMQVGQRLNKAALESAPHFRVDTPFSEDTAEELPVPMGVFALVGAARRALTPAAGDHVRSVRQDVADGWLTILVDALGSVPLLPPGQTGLNDRSVLVEVEMLLTAAVSYPSILYAVEKAINGLTTECAEKAARVRIRGAPRRAPYIFVYFKEVISRHARDHRNFVRLQSQGDHQTVVCDNDKHFSTIARRNFTGTPTMKSSSCSACHTFVYCSLDCQRGDWNEIHAATCSSFASSRIAAERAHSWYRSSYRVWHLYLQSLVCNIAVAAGLYDITVLDYTQAHRLAPAFYPMEKYPYANLGRQAKDPRFMFAGPDFHEPSFGATVSSMLKCAADLMHAPWLRRPGMREDEKPMVRLIEGIYPWKEQATDGTGARVLVMGQYLIVPSESPERDWDIELLASAVRVWDRGMEARE